MAIQQANEASSALAIPVSSRASHTRPHLVTSSDRRPTMDSEVAVPHAREALQEVPASDPGALERRLIRARNTLETKFPGGVPRGALNMGIKRAFDVCGAIVLGIVFAPLIGAIVLLMRRENGPVIYRHQRIGQNGRTFECLKFRTMVPNADQVLRELLEREPTLKVEWLRDHKLRNDPRVTALGRFLRRTSLDELPQLWNVLRGEMSLVGPRPVVREELMRYGRSLPFYLCAKPGITGLWQVTGRNDTDYRRRVAMDVCYVRNQNLFLDLYILLKTTGVVLGGGAY